MKQAIYAWLKYPHPNEAFNERLKARKNLWYGVKVLAYDGDKYCKVEAGGVIFEVKRGYLKRDNPSRWRKSRMKNIGRPNYRNDFSHRQMMDLPRSL